MVSEALFCRKMNDHANSYFLVSLPSSVAVWLVSEEAKFLRGKFVWSNWDVEELIAREQEIVANQEMLTLGLMGHSMQGWKLEQVLEYGASL